MESTRKPPESKGKRSVTYKPIGLDGIHPRVLKELADVLTEPLSIIYQQSWLTEEVPVD